MSKRHKPSSERRQVNKRITASLARRKRTEHIFRSLGLFSVVIGFLMVFLLLFDITHKALPAFQQHWVNIDIEFNQEWLNENNSESVETYDFRNVFRQSVYTMFPEVTEPLNKRALIGLFSSYADLQVKTYFETNVEEGLNKATISLLLDDDADIYFKEANDIGQPYLRINTLEATWLKQLYDSGRIEKRFNSEFFTNTDSREPELAGIKGAMAGTILTMIVTFVLSFPVGVGAALYLEEFAPKNKITDLIEININNLAAVPSIIFGLLGMSIIINVFNLPRSAPIVGGIVLSLMTLPTIIIASRAAIKAVPPSIREAAYGLGASKVQTAFGHVLPIALPGILTGTIIGMAQAIGETAPLLLIGMVAFIVDVPTLITDSATVMPVQIFLWADSPERSFIAKTSAAIMVLLCCLFVMNAIAAYIRRRFERR